MAKKISLINVELEKFEKKLAEFQSYLEENSINSYSEEKFKEQEMQIKIMDAVLRWLPQLELLRGEEGKKTVELRKGSTINGLMQSQLDNDNE